MYGIFQAMVVHIDDKINMLASFGLDSKQIIFLVSNQVVQICDDLFEFRQHASNVDTSNRMATAARFAWVTLQALNKMDEYMRSKFKHHAGITGTFTRFLTRQTAQTSAAGLSTKLKAMESKLTTLTTNSTTEAMHSRVDTKLEAVINANNLKRSSQ